MNVGPVVHHPKLNELHSRPETQTDYWKSWLLVENTTSHQWNPSAQLIRVWLVNSQHMQLFSCLAPKQIFNCCPNQEAKTFEWVGATQIWCACRHSPLGMVFKQTLVQRWINNQWCWNASQTWWLLSLHVWSYLMHTCNEVGRPKWRIQCWNCVPFCRGVNKYV